MNTPCILPTEKYGSGGNRTYQNVWDKAYGRPPKGMDICHYCDNEYCHNLDHLFLATHKQNMQDKGIKSRVTNAKLTHIQVKEIRKQYKPWTITAKMLAKKYGVSEPTIKNILSGKTYLGALEGIFD